MVPTYRRFGPDEAETVCQVFAHALNDTLERLRMEPYVDMDDEAAWRDAWQTRRPLFEHLSATAEQAWLAERGGQVIGYARSIRRGAVYQLTEFFIHPDHQVSGVGKELLARAFPAGDYKRVVVSTTHGPALALYLRAGVDAQCTICDFSRAPERRQWRSDLRFEPLRDDDEVLASLSELDEAVLGYRREADHRWLMRNREGFLYIRDRTPVGYGYVGHWSGPFALLDPADFPSVLAHAETRAHAAGYEFMLGVSLGNRPVVEHLLAHGFRMDAEFLMLFMSDKPSGGFDRYVFSMPGFFT